MARLMDKKWEDIQKKAFTRWTNSHLNKKKYPLIQNLADEFQTGIKLMEVVNALYDIPFPPKYSKEPKMRPHKLDNISMALDMLTEQAGVKTNFLKPGHLIDCDEKMLLGMIWSIILDYQIKGISVEELTAKEGLLLWCQRKTAGYKDVDVKNFTTSWQDGLAFCALIHRHRPDLIDYDSLSKNNPRENLELAFSVAEKELDIMRLLDIEDLLDVPRPDEKSVITYVSEYFHKFSAQNQVEVAGRRIANLVALARANDQMKNDYINRAQALVDWTNQTKGEMQDREYDQTLSGIQGKWDNFKDYRRKTKPEKTAEKIATENSLNQLQAKLRLNNRQPFVPPEHLTPQAIDQLWNGLGQDETDRSEWIRKELDRQIRLEAIANRFWRKAAALLTWGSDNNALLTAPDLGDSVAAVQAKLKNHEGFEGTLQYSESRLKTCQSLGNELLSENYGRGEEVKAKLAEIDAMWASVQQNSTDRRSKLEQELARQQKLDSLRVDFATKSRTLLTWIEDAEDGELAEPTQTNSTKAIAELQDAFTKFQEEMKAHEAEYNALMQLSQDMVQEGITSNMYSTYTMEQVTDRWNRLNASIAERQGGLSEEAKRQSDNDEACKLFASKAGEFLNQCNAVKTKISAPNSCELEAQLENAKALNAEAVALGSGLDELRNISNDIEERNVVYNPHTDATIESVTFTHDGVVEMSKKDISLIEKQILEKSGSGVTEEQLAEFKETFDTFDKDKSNTLEKHEFKACLQALGHDLSDAAIDSLMQQHCKAIEGKIVFEEFVNYMIQKTEDTDSPSTIKNAFREIAGNKDHITADDLKKVPGLEPETIEYLINNMPKSGEGQMDYDGFTDKQYSS